VNAKNPVKMNYIVKNYPTKWGAKSIVDATIKLLELAYQNGHEWFVLLAYDVYPLVSFGEFKNFMKYQTKSMFNVIKQHENEWKASQWWILCRRDVETILSRHAEYDDYLTKIKYTITGAWDELYFLSLLKYVSPTYSFLEYKTVYTEWMQNSQQSHPVTYNKILPFDLEKMKGSFFLRKTTKQKLKSLAHSNDDDLMQFATPRGLASEPPEEEFEERAGSSTSHGGYQQRPVLELTSYFDKKGKTIRRLRGKTQPPKKKHDI
jgi:hypothetical protein